MPYPSEHSARMHSPGKFSKYASKEIAPGVRVILGINNGKTSVQAYRFNTSHFTADQAKAWLKRNGKSPISFEAASGGKTSELRKKLGA